MSVSELPSIPGHFIGRLGDDDAAALDDLNARCADFLQLIERRSPRAGDGLAALHDRPTDAAAELKLTLGVFGENQMIGVIDMLRGYPTPDVWYIGLLMLAPEARGRGLGSAALAAIRDWARCNGATSLRIAVQSQNAAALHFWRGHGFKQLRSVQQQNGALSNTVLVMEAGLSAPASPGR
jgi:GNAT superfamily N-acetyltransferase